MCGLDSKPLHLEQIGRHWLGLLFRRFFCLQSLFLSWRLELGLWFFYSAHHTFDLFPLCLSRLLRFRFWYNRSNPCPNETQVEDSHAYFHCHPDNGHNQVEIDLRAKLCSQLV